MQVLCNPTAHLLKTAREGKSIPLLIWLQLFRVPILREIASITERNIVSNRDVFSWCVTATQFRTLAHCSTIIESTAHGRLE